MAIAPGTHLGRYLIMSSLGKGGMGEVYQARDTQIGRKVALKILPKLFAVDKERLRRFEKEAQTIGALNHPNILIIYDVGTYQGTPYLVSELLEGETLRSRLNSGPLSTRSMIDYAIQIAHGLAAAHEKGIVHRDLKPENLFITDKNRAKILDFGLAKFMTLANASDSHTNAPTIEPDTNPGVIIGTVGYMSPEQVRGSGADLDHRSDIFSYGAVLYEMLTRKRAFHGASAVETMNAVLTHDPFEGLSLSSSSAPEPALERIVRHCLEKNPEHRFQSARDLAFHLEGLSQLSNSNPILQPLSPKRSYHRLSVALAVALGILLLIFGSFLVGKQIGARPLATYRQLTFRRGAISAARFAPDGRTIFYSAAWNGSQFDIYSARVENPESRSLGMENADILAVSSAGEMAVLLNRQYISHFINRGTLARIPLLGGTPREILEDIQQADWSPDGSNLAVVHYVAGQYQLEFPIGKVLYRTGGYISYPRVSPDGNLVAFFDHPTQRDNRGSVAVVDLNGNKRVLSGELADPQGLAWYPDGGEVCFTASRAGESSGLHYVTLKGREATLLRVPNNLLLHDISPDGRFLLTAFSQQSSIIGLPPGATKERDLSWLDRGSIYDLSADGKVFVFQYYGEGSGTNYTAYLRKTDGSPAIKLGDGAGVLLSPDGKWVVAVFNEPRQLALLPTRTGEVRRLDLGGFEDHGNYSWFPDSKRLLFTGKTPTQGLRCYAQDIETGEVRPVTPVGITGNMLSPDGKFIIVTDPQHKRLLYPLEGGTPRQILGLEDDDEIIRWAADAQSLFVRRRVTLPIRIERIDLSTGRREFWREVQLTDATGILRPPNIFLSSDGKSYVYQLRRHLSDLFIIEGLAP